MPFRLVEESANGVVPHKSAEKRELERKRETAIAAKEASRQRREQERKVGVAGASDGAGRKAGLAAKKEAEIRAKAESRAGRIKDTEAKRAVRQKDVDAERAAHAKSVGSKYSKKEILILFDLFAEYDQDGGGEISVVEFKTHFKKRTDDSSRYDGKSKNFAERRAARAGLDLAALVEPMFMALDKDQSGSVTFFELIKLLYPLANERDIATFKEWCYPDKPIKKINYVLGAEQKQELKDMFRIIDKDRSGEITVEELKAMFQGSAITGETGVDGDELNSYFAEADFDNSNAINLAEFEKLMVSTGLYVPEVVDSVETVHSGGYSKVAKPK